MAHVTIIKSGYTEAEIKQIIADYERIGFSVDVVDNMSEAVDGTMKMLRDW